MATYDVMKHKKRKHAVADAVPKKSKKGRQKNRASAGETPEDVGSSKHSVIPKKERMRDMSRDKVVPKKERKRDRERDEVVPKKERKRDKERDATSVVPKKERRREKERDEASVVPKQERRREKERDEKASVKREELTAKEENAPIKKEQVSVKEEPSAKEDTELSLEDKCRREQQLFEDCENDVLPIMDRIESAFKEENVPNLKKSLRRMTKCIATITAPFIREYLPQDVIKGIRKEYRGKDDEIFEASKKLWLGIRSIYNNSELPVSFKPVKRRDRANADAVKTERPYSPSNSTSVAPAGSEAHAKTSADAIKDASGTHARPTDADRTISKSSSRLPKKSPSSLDEPPPAKPPRKSFSLKGFLGPKPLPPKAPDEGTATTLPRWIRGARVALPQNADRELALELVGHAVEHRGVDVESVAW